jgi:hypothetical protein
MSQAGTLGGSSGPPPTTPITFTNVGGLVLNGANTTTVPLGGTLTLGFPYDGVVGPTTAISNNGYVFVSSQTLTLPAAPNASDKISIITDVLGVVIKANAGQVIRISGQTSSTAGTATNTKVGDTLELIYGDGIWISQNANGGWNLA